MKLAVIFSETARNGLTVQVAKMENELDGTVTAMIEVSGGNAPKRVLLLRNIGNALEIAALLLNDFNGVPRTHLVPSPTNDKVIVSEVTYDTRTGDRLKSPAEIGLHASAVEITHGNAPPKPAPPTKAETEALQIAINDWIARATAHGWTCEVLGFEPRLSQD